MAKKRNFLFAVMAVTASTRRVALGLSRNSIRTHTLTAAKAVDDHSSANTGTTIHRNTIKPQPEEWSCLGDFPTQQQQQQQSRKQALRSMAAVVLAGAASSAIAPSPSQAFDRSFPIELTDVDKSNYDDKNTGVLIGKRSNVQQRKQKAEESKKQLDQNLESFTIKKDLLPSLTWGLAIFFGSGSRSNPLATPLANLMYDETQEKWLRERNLGLFSAPPIEFLVLQGFIFLLLGTVLEYSLLQLSGGDSVVVGQLAGVALINGGFFEIGRIASGEKGLTRDENDRAVQLEDEFEEFAEKRLKQGGNCHRSDVVKSFRRYFAKYRQVDSEQYPLTDLEIEKLLRSWNRKQNQNRAEMRSTGFYYGIQINTDADVFV